MKLYQDPHVPVDGRLTIKLALRSTVPTGGKNGCGSCFNGKREK